VLCSFSRKPVSWGCIWRVFALGFCEEFSQRSIQPVVVERTSQLTMVQELVSLSHGVSMVPAMARVLDQSDR